MTIAKQIAQHYRDLHYGPNTTGINFKETLAGVTWQQATTKVKDLNTIAVLVFHVNYYVAGVAQVLEGGTLDIRDKYSFDMPPIQSEEDWEKLLAKFWTDAERFAHLIEQLPDDQLSKGFVLEKYGNYYRNLNGLIEHSYYHLGQIALLKKSLNAEE